MTSFVETKCNPEVAPSEVKPPEVDSDAIVAPDISHLELEDDTPLDNFQSEKQQRLLVEPLYSSPALPQPFIVAANVGIFSSNLEPGIAPDAFLSLDVQMPNDWSLKENRSYLAWQFGKFPEVVIEVVSNRKGNELVAKEPGKSKQAAYARMGIAYYVVFDPLRQIQEPAQMNGELLKVFVLTGKHYTELSAPLSAPFWLEDVGVGLTLWEGKFEELSDIWLRWSDANGQVIPTGAESAELERQRANAEQERANAEQERANAEQERAEQAEAELLELRERLRAKGIDLDRL